MSPVSPKESKARRVFESFVRCLYELAEHCDFGTIRDQQKRDRIVIGNSDKTVLQKLQLKSALTLETAIQIACQSELVKSQVTDQSSYVPKIWMRCTLRKNQHIHVEGKQKERRSLREGYAGIPAMSKKTFDSFLYQPKLHPSSIALFSPEDKLQCVGQFTTAVNHCNKKYEVDIFVISGEHASNLLGNKPVKWV